MRGNTKGGVDWKAHRGAQLGIWGWGLSWDPGPGIVPVGPNGG